ncbi:protein kinase [Solirubrobacter taibaiensis]|nr:protein kinase [Solirubrobacter taibaiensis]
MEPLRSGALFGDYRIEGPLGRGGMGIVYRAQQQRPLRTVALKVIAPDLSADPTFRARFDREAELAASIEHPNIAPVYDVGERDGQLYIAMRFVDGADLGTVLREGPLSPQRAVLIVERLASALNAAHQSGLIHRDVKPANVLLRRSSEGDEHVYLTDFGLARRVEDSDAMTGSGQFLGTPGYAAPEQIRGLSLDARADVYSLGCLLFEALTGQRPFPRKDSTAVMWAHVNDPAPRASAVYPNVPPRFDDVIAMAMAKDPAARFTSATAFARAAAGALNPTMVGCPACQGPILPEAILCGHCGADARDTLAITGTHATLPLGDSPPATLRRPSHPAPARTVEHRDQAPGARSPRRRVAWLPVAGAAMLAAVIVLAVLSLTGSPEDTPNANAAQTGTSTPTVTGGPDASRTTTSGTDATDGNSTSGSPSATATATTDEPESAGSGAKASGTQGEDPAATSEPVETATPRPKRRKPKVAAVPSVPVAKTVAFNTGTDAGKAMPAAHCRISKSALYCWTPNDGYTLTLSPSGAPTRARGDEPGNKRRVPDGYDRLGFGSTRAKHGFRCTNREDGLSCQNDAGHGFTLPRYVGLPSTY